MEQNTEVTFADVQQACRTLVTRIGASAAREAIIMAFGSVKIEVVGKMDPSFWRAFVESVNGGGSSCISKTTTLDALENTRDPKRAPLPYFTERAQFDPFNGFVCKSSTQHQEPQRSFGRFVSPDMQDNGPQVAPGFGSAALVVKG